jgi:hypothetical protein
LLLLLLILSLLVLNESFFFFGFENFSFNSAPSVKLMLVKLIGDLFRDVLVSLFSFGLVWFSTIETDESEESDMMEQLGDLDFVIDRRFVAYFFGDLCRLMLS